MHRLDCDSKIKTNHSVRKARKRFGTTPAPRSIVQRGLMLRCCRWNTERHLCKCYRQNSHSQDHSQPPSQIPNGCCLPCLLGGWIVLEQNQQAVLVWFTVYYQKPPSSRLPWEFQKESRLLGITGVLSQGARMGLR